MKIAVIDIGSKAVKMIIGDRVPAQNEKFNFLDYNNFGKPTYLGDSIKKNDIDFNSIKTTTSVVRNYYQQAIKLYRVDHVYVIGTEVFRRVNDNSDLVKFIIDNTGIENFRVLSSKEEASYSLLSCIYTCSSFINKQDYVINIDQGGGSTEISVAEYIGDRDFNTLKLNSYNFGALSVYNELMSSNGKLGKVFTKLVNHYASLISNNWNLNFDKGRSIKIFGMGSGITSFRKKSNRKKHGLDLFQEEFSNLIAKKVPDIPVKSIKKDEDKEDIQLRLSKVLAAKTAEQLLKKYNLQSLKICSAGLRYGVLFSHINDSLKEN